MAPPSVPSIISDIVAAGKKFESNEPGSREALVNLGQALSMALEIPSEFIQRSMWAEVSANHGRVSARPFLLSGAMGARPSPGALPPSLCMLEGI